MPYSVGGSYEYNAVCDSCNDQVKASELRLRWDGLMVCKADWETRHPSDFYRTRNDAHKLPWTRVDDGKDAALVWAAQSIILLTYAVDALELPSNPAGEYRIDNLRGKTSGTAFLAKFTDLSGYLTPANPRSSTSSTGQTLVLPTTPTTAGNILVRTSYGEILGSVAITPGSPNVMMPTWTSKAGHITVAFTFGT